MAASRHASVASSCSISERTRRWWLLRRIPLCKAPIKRTAAGENNAEKKKEAAAEDRFPAQMRAPFSAERPTDRPPFCSPEDEALWNCLSGRSVSAPLVLHLSLTFVCPHRVSIHTGEPSGVSSADHCRCEEFEKHVVDCSVVADKQGAQPGGGGGRT